MRIRTAFSFALIASIAFACSKTQSESGVATAKTPPAASASTASVESKLAAPAGWLSVRGNKLLGTDGKPFHGRGANIHDTRSCNSCTWGKPNAGEVLRRVDMLTDGWKANFVRLLLESYDKPEGRTTWASLMDDPQYFADVQKIVAHVGTKKGVTLMLSVWHDPSLGKKGLPTPDTIKLWKKLATAFKDSPHVIFGLVNEPEENYDGSEDQNVWKAMNDTVAAIREVEGSGPKHVIAVQGTRAWARVLDYYVTHPITAGGGANIVYETHVYDPRDQFKARFIEPSKKIPVIIGEFGPVTDIANMKMEDCSALMDEAEKAEVPYLGYTFHFRCPPNMLIDNSNNGCGEGTKLEPSPWGTMLKDRLAKPWP